MMNKKILLSMLAIGLIAVSAGAGTWAAFTDTETSSDNVFTSGIIDIAIDSDGDTIFAAQDMVATSDDDSEVSLPKFFNYFDVPNNDIKPGNCGEVTISIHTKEDSNPADVYMTLGGIVNTDPYTSEPERLKEDGTQVNQLSQELMVMLWRDNGGGILNPCGVAGDNVHQSCETILYPSLEITEGVFVGSVPGWTDMLPLSEFEGLGVYIGLIGSDSTEYIGFAWELPLSVGNEHQGDRTTFDVTFNANQPSVGHAV